MFIRLLTRQSDWRSDNLFSSRRNLSKNYKGLPLQKKSAKRGYTCIPWPDSNQAPGGPFAPYAV